MLSSDSFGPSRRRESFERIPSALIELLQKASEDIDCLALLLENFKEDEDVGGDMLPWIGRHMERPNKMLAKLLGIIGDIEPYTCDAGRDC
ncbi:hypothetical protein C4J81_03710 [Deltaproteobacteria bacterium Smac51]|nr:hypothetical protein C4J81_03710 [Deltaproteobacteria bacterium Smac51]